MVFQAIGSPFKVNAETVTLFSIPTPVVATAANGDYVVVWSSPYSDTDTDLKFRRFNADGTPKDSTDRVVANSGASNERFPAVAMASDGSFVVAYVTTPTSGGDENVVVRRFDAAGSQLGSEIGVATVQVERNQSNPAIAIDAAGNFAVTWTHSFSNSDSDVRMRVFSSNGTPLTGDEAVASSGSLNEYNPDIAFRTGANALNASDTAFVVTWNQGPADGSSVSLPPAQYDTDIVFQRYNSAGTKLGSAIRANNSTALSQRDPSIALDSQGNFVIAWTHRGTNNDDVRYRQFNSLGQYRTGNDNERVVDNGTGNQETSDIAMASDGRFVVTYNDIASDNIEYQEFTSDGTLVGSQQTYNTTTQGTRFSPSIAMNAGGTRMVIAVYDDSVHLFDPHARIFATPAPVVQFSQAAYQSSEGTGTSNAITLTRVGETFASSQIQVNVTGGTATAGADYTNTGFPLTVNFAAGETSKTVAIPIIQDATVEGTETIAFSITGLSNAAIGTTNTATLQILDDDTNTGTGTGTGTGTPGVTNDRLIGDASANILVGGAGDNFIWGKGGKDTLTGGSGIDKFVFDVGTRFNKRVMGVDVITDFTRGADTIVLDRTTFARLKGSTLKKTDFASVKTVAQARNSKALITYVGSSGALFYNENRATAGFGVGGQFADLTNGLPLARTDISMIS
ncbi:MAG TPA: Calx-beta domain-containing protein [Coleofasciculaceae cyanobacterium]|jgi:Ca2+-binding RTX toxin-like protein